MLGILISEIPYHGIDPMILPIGGGIGLRWYGLMYAVGFTIGYYILVRLSKAKLLPADREDIGNLVFYMILGVVIGGRLGYAIFYDSTLLNPIKFVQVWRGGLSFHGGLLGITIGVLYYARTRKVSFLRVGDCIALGATPGIFCVRVANFINGELFGRITNESVPWAMRFPKDPIAINLLSKHPLLRRYFETGNPRDEEIGILKAIREGIWDKISKQVPLRHPSQLYEALFEGLFLGFLLLLVYKVSKKKGRFLPNGAYAGIFLGGYGIARFFIEFFREPDPQLGYVLGPFTRGQELCFLMVVFSVVIILYSFKKGKRA